MLCVQAIGHGSGRGFAIVDYTTIILKMGGALIGSSSFVCLLRDLWYTSTDLSQPHRTAVLFGVGDFHR